MGKNTEHQLSETAETREKVGNQEFIKQLKHLIDTKQFTQKEIARKTGYSVASISTYLNGTYAGNLENFEPEIEKFLVQWGQKSKYKRVVLNFVDTSIAKRFFTVAKITQFNSEIGLCFGASGIGKTTAIKEYAKTNSGVIALDPDEKASVRALLRQLAKGLRLEDSNCLLEVFIADIVKRLKGSGKLIIIDEAEFLNVEHFRVLRKIHDRCEASIGMLFVGTHKLFDNLSKLPGEYRYIQNRICYIEALENIEFSDVEMLVNQVYPNCPAEVLKSFAISCGYNARVLFNLLKRVNDLIVCNKEELTPELISATRKLLL